jgi:hypothetical protein
VPSFLFPRFINSRIVFPPKLYKAAAIPAAMAPRAISPLDRTFEVAALPVDDAVAADPVSLAVLEPEDEVLLLEVSSVAAPKTPPWTVSGDEPWALAAAVLYASSVLPLDL